MKQSEHIKLYDTLWHFLNAEGRRTALFGEECERRAREAFLSCTAGSSMPIVYLELPLAGTPRFDLQVCIDRASLRGEVRVPDGAPVHERSMLEWLAGPQGSCCTGIDLAFDISAGDTTSPQLIALPGDGSFEGAETFFALVGAPDGAAWYRAAERRMPRGWCSWYTGLIPGRPGSPVRLDYYVSRRRAQEYRQDASLLVDDLERMGYAATAHERAWCERLLELPCGVNLQLDAYDEDTMGPVLGFNLIEGSLGPSATRESLGSGWMRRALGICEAWGLADARWHHLSGLCQAKALVMHDVGGTSMRLSLAAKPTFIKVRMTRDELIDAKAYVMCTFREIPQEVP